MINNFRGPYRFLSNFYLSPVVLDAQTYPTVEHAYQAAKNDSPLYRARILADARPSNAKRLGHSCSLPSNWSTHRLAVMEQLLRQKFVRGGRLATMLLATGDHELIEGNTWGDQFWGVCNGVGENRLGQLLMAIRTDRLRSSDAG